jgi:hypothetical protein
MTTENASLAVDVTAAPDGVEEGFFRRGAEEDRAAREQLRRRLTEMPRWPALGWAIGLVGLAVVVAVVLLFVVPPPS